MTGLLDDAGLLAALGEALAPEAATPRAADLDALRRALDERVVSVPVLPTVTIVPLARPRSRIRRAGPLRRLRHPVAVGVAAAMLATSGVAAAAVATDHLPGPTRAVAYDLGLPVMSPALVAARHTLDDLRAALATGDDARARADAALLRSQLAALSPSDRATLQTQADAALARADALPVAPGAPADRSAGGSAGGGAGSNGGRAVDDAPVAGRSSSTGGTPDSPDGPRPGTGETPTGGSGTSDPGSTPTPSPTAGTEDGSSGTTATPAGSADATTTTPPGATTGTTTRRSSDDGSSDGGTAPTDNAVAAPTTTPPRS